MSRHNELSVFWSNHPHSSHSITITTPAAGSFRFIYLLRPLARGDRDFNFLNFSYLAAYTHSDTERRVESSRVFVDVRTLSLSLLIGDDALLRTSPFTTASLLDPCDQHPARLTDSIHPFFKFSLSFACGTLGVMLATTTTTAHPSPRWSFSLFNTHIEFRSMFIAILLLFLFLCLGQYARFSPITLFFCPFLFRFRSSLVSPRA